MKQCFFLVFLYWLTVFTQPASAQNPKTNAGKLGKTTPAARPTSAPSQPSSPAPSKAPSRPADVIEEGTHAPTNPISHGSRHQDSNFTLVSFNGVLGLTQKQFKEVSNSDWGVGLSLSAMYNFMGTASQVKSPINIYLGGSFEYLYFGGNSHTISYDEPYFPGNAITNEVTTSVKTNVYSLFVVSRAEFFNGPVVPFIEGSLGARMFDGVQKIELEQSQKPGTSLPPGAFTPSVQKFSDNLEKDIVLAYGYGGGLRVGTPSVSLEFKVMYMYGTRGRYIDRESVSFDQQNKVSYKTKTSYTDMLLPQIGVSTLF